jgi:hypothetical protein
MIPIYLAPLNHLPSSETDRSKRSSKTWLAHTGTRGVDPYDFEGTASWGGNAILHLKRRLSERETVQNCPIDKDTLPPDHDEG